MPSYEDYVGEEAMKQGPSMSQMHQHMDEAMYHGGAPLDKSYPKQGSGKPTQQPKMYFKAKPKQ